MSLPTNCRELLDHLAPQDEVIRNSLAQAKEFGLDWPATCESVLTAVLVHRKELLEEIALFRQKGMRLIPVLTMEQAVERLDQYAKEHPRPMPLVD